MISLQNTIKYLGLALIVFFLIKAFANDKLDNKQIILLVILIMAVVIFLANQQVTCPRKEHYQITDPPIVDSIYPGPDNTNPILGKPKPYKLDRKVEDEDIEDMKSIVGLDKKTYEKLVENEEKAMKKIQSRYQDEMVFTSTHPFNTIPLGTQIYGYTYLPPENWFRAYERPPVCITDKRCPVCPIASSSTSDLMEFDTANNTLGPEGIDLRYVKRVLNGQK